MFKSNKEVAPPKEENVYYFLQKYYPMAASTVSLKTRLADQHKIMEYEKLYFPIINKKREIPNFLACQVAVKSDRVIFTQYLMQGRRSEALTLMKEDYHFGQLLDKSNTLIGRLIGIAVKTMSNAGLSIYMLNSCETKEDLQEFNKVINSLYKNNTVELFEETFKRNKGEFWNVFPPVPTNENKLKHYLSNIPNILKFKRESIKEAETRENVAKTKFELLRTATAAKYKYITDGVFPKINSDFAPFLANGPSNDPFIDQPLKYFNGEEKFVCYSVGPDKTDESAKTTYDPTNGTISGGDIVLEVPKKREYPFPRDGVKVNTAEELKAMFPNGLPADPFADTRGKNLSITNTSPVIVYSFGPDTDEMEHRDGFKVNTARDIKKHELELMYDPTNGVISDGDLFFELPMRK